MKAIQDEVNVPRKKMDISIKKAPVCYKLPPWIIRWLREQSIPAGRLIEEALKQYYRLTEPSTEQILSRYSESKKRGCPT